MQFPSIYDADAQRISLNLLFSYEAVIPKRGVLQPREGSPIDTTGTRSFVQLEKQLRSGWHRTMPEKFKLSHHQRVRIQQ